MSKVAELCFYEGTAQLQARGGMESHKTAVSGWYLMQAQPGP